MCRSFIWSSLQARSGWIPTLHDIRFVEDDWESPTLGAWGLGWEVWCDGMEITQFTYFQQVGGIDCDPVCAEITYGLERLAMYVQNVEFVYDLAFNEQFRYGEVFHQNEQEFSAYNFERADTEILFRHFKDAEKQCQELLDWQEAGAARLRPVHQGQPCLQSAGCARRDQRDRARRLYRRACARWPRPAAKPGWQTPMGAYKPTRCRLMPDLLLELFSEEIPARMQARRGERSGAAGGRRAVGSRLAVRRHQGLRRAAAADAGDQRASRQAGRCARGDERPQASTRRQKAIEGFLRTAGLTWTNARRSRTTAKGEVYIAVIEREGPRDRRMCWRKSCPR